MYDRHARGTSTGAVSATDACVYTSTDAHLHTHTEAHLGRLTPRWPGTIILCGIIYGLFSSTFVFQAGLLSILHKAPLQLFFCFCFFLALPPPCRSTYLRASSQAVAPLPSSSAESSPRLRQDFRGMLYFLPINLALLLWVRIRTIMILYRGTTIVPPSHFATR